MVNLYIAYTAPINPPNATPVLTTEQCWAGLQRKIRNAPEFVGAITKCDVLEDKDGVVTREVVFGAQPDKRVKEVCRSFEPMKVRWYWIHTDKGRILTRIFKVDFHQTDGSIISNIISNGPSQEPTDLYMTYAFQWLHPEIEEGSKEVQEKSKSYKAMSKMAVDKSIEAIRRLVDEGQIK